MPAENLLFRLDRVKDHDAPRRSAEAFGSVIRRRGGALGGARDRVFAVIHPALPPFQILPAANGLEVHASSWPGGPGYHEVLLATISEIATEADVELTVEDATGFHHSRDRAALEATLSATLVAAAREALAFLDRAGDTAHLQFGLPLPAAPGALRVAGDPPGIFTPDGPRDRAWLEALASSKLSAREYYPWWPAELDGEGHRRLARSLLETQITWRPAATDEQRALRRAALDGFRRGAIGAPPEAAALLATLERFAEGEQGTVPAGLRHVPRLAPLAGGWTAIVPGHYETAAPNADAVPAVVEAGQVYLDRDLRIETLAQPAPEGIPLDERIDHLFGNPQASGAPQRRTPDHAGYLVERKLSDGGTGLVASFVGPTTHLIVRMLAAKDLDPSIPQAIWTSITPSSPSPRFLAI